MLWPRFLLVDAIVYRHPQPVCPKLDVGPREHGIRILDLRSSPIPTSGSSKGTGERAINAAQRGIVTGLGSIDTHWGYHA